MHEWTRYMNEYAHTPYKKRWTFPIRAIPNQAKQKRASNLQLLLEWIPFWHSSHYAKGYRVITFCSRSAEEMMILCMVSMTCNSWLLRHRFPSASENIKSSIWVRSSEKSGTWWTPDTLLPLLWQLARACLRPIPSSWLFSLFSPVSILISLVPLSQRWENLEKRQKIYINTPECLLKAQVDPGFVGPNVHIMQERPL